MLIKNIKTLGNLLFLLAFCTISTNAAKANPWENKELQSAAAFSIEQEQFLISQSLGHEEYAGKPQTGATS